MLVISGGGTGGHFFPALSFMEYAKNREKILFVGAKRGIEFKLKKKIPCESLFLEIYPFRGVSFSKKMKAVFSYLNSLKNLSDFIKEDFRSLIFGGYASFPLGLFTVLKKKKLYVHEQNSIPSRTNKILSKKAEKVFITFEWTRKFFKNGIKTGLPVRKEILNKIDKNKAKEILNLNPEKETLLIMGGSQGAEFLNIISLEVKKFFNGNVILICGERNYEKMKEFKGENFLIIPFSLEMNVIYSASDIAITRAGASTITELSIYGIPSLFIPYPYAVDDHQYYNAKEIEELGGGFVLRQEEYEAKKLKDFLEKLRERKEEMSKNIKEFANPRASENIYRLTREG